ncbi:DEAD/DEAH box helicase [Kutzneria sp. 744]|uniref:DEAD/DEAH box helicase n=1 Tax=Kutzneria sp. (strain 744) TaxID=345341 RepID=UPI0004AECE99|nr:DEAD/DEAH box helicase [Kutzneria sp. 744]
MSSPMLPNIDLASLAKAVDSRTHARGVQYARQRRVRMMSWTRADGELVGEVVGSGDVYATTAWLSGTPLRFDEGECSCPVGYNCKHVVALVLNAAGTEKSAARAPQKTPPTWRQSLDALFEPAPGEAAGQQLTPLAIELTLTATASPRFGAADTQPALTVSARLVKPGKNGWIAAVTWGRLDSYHATGHVASHVRLLQEMRNVYRSARSHYGNYYHSDEKTLDLSAFDSHRLWPLLDEAEGIGIRLVHGKKRLGDVRRYGSAQLLMDVTQTSSSGALAVTPVLHVASEDDGDAAPFRFIGADGHGVVHVDRADVRAGDNPADWRLRLARMATPVPAALQRMAETNGHLEIPAAEQARFREEYYPRLRRVATVISSDDSFAPPEISAPTLVLRASYGTDHALGVDWEWAYDVDGSPLRAPLHGGADAGYRNPAQEREILADLDIPPDWLAQLSGQDAKLVPHTEFGSIDTMRFTTELLPLLADQPGVTVEVDGQPADYRETGDSLTIGVSTDEIAGDADWFGLGITVSVEDRQVPFLDVFLALSRGQTHLLRPDGAYFSLQKPELRTLGRLIEEARALRDAPAGELRISRFQAGLWAELAELGVVDRQAAAWRRQVEGLLSIESVEDKEPPSTLDAHLRPYQLAGFRWLAFLWECRLGGVLADDMGLGKTVQSLALICHARLVEPEAPPFLIVAPTSVVSNWAAESARFAPGLKVVAVADTLRRRGQALDELADGADVVITSYTLFRLDFDAYSAAAWSGLVLDEAQAVKNHQSKAHQCARLLPAPFKLAITGTPMENNLMELWSLLSITAPGLFPSPTRFTDYYARPIEKRGDAELLAQLRRRVKPLMRRRTKEQVATDLPAKQEQTLEVDLHPKHRKIYQTQLQRERQKVLGLVDDMNKNRFTILRSLTLLRQLSLHAGLADDAHAALPSAKIDALCEQLRDVVDGGHRALVFSQFTGFLGKVRERLVADGMDFCYLDGRTRNRAAVLERFKDGSAPVFLISLKAGGFGLNLTEADYCFLLDPWWNPATEAQAVDRTHRIGQTRNVMVYRLIAKDTIEEKVMALKERKARLFTSVMDDGDVFNSSLDADDIRTLFA